MRFVHKNSNMRPVWALIPLVLIGIIGIDESFANDSTVSKNGLILTLSTDKSTYSPNESIRFTINMENSNLYSYWYQGSDGCQDTNESNMNFQIKELGGFVRLHPTNPIDHEMVCTTAHVDVLFEPLEKITKEFVWNQSYSSNRETLKISPGTYTLEGSLLDVTDDGFDNPLITEIKFEILDSAVFEPEPMFKKEFVINSGKDESRHKESVFESPKTQLEKGLESRDVICNGSLYLVYKTSDGSPTCVNEYFSAPKLVARGWATLGDTKIIIDTDKDKYLLGEHIKISMKNMGDTRVLFSGSPTFSLSNEFNRGIDFPLDIITPPVERISSFDTLSSTEYVWNQHHRNGESVKHGTYTISANYLKPILGNDMGQFNQMSEKVTRTFEIVEELDNP